MKKATLNGEIASLTLELSMLLHAGVSVSDALALLSEEDEYKELLKGTAQQADEGATLAQCLRNSGRFPAYVCGLIEVGENAGRTEEALSALSQYYERRVRLERQIQSALLYPAVMLVLMFVIIGVLLVKVMPIFDDVYASLGERMTGVAGGLLRIGQWIDNIMPMIWGLLAAIIVFFVLFTLVRPFREKADILWKRFCGDRGVFREINVAKLAQAVAMGVSSGLSGEKAVELAQNLLEDNPAAKKRCIKCRDMIERGEKMSDALKKSGIFSAKSSRLLDIGQQSGVIDSTLEKIAADMSEKAEGAVEDTVSRIEPALVLICSLLVGVILLAVVLPLMHIMSAIG